MRVLFLSFCMAGFVMVGLVEADRAGLDRAPARFGHQRDDRGAVYTAGEEGAKRDVGDHARADGRPHDIGQLFGERLRSEERRVGTEGVRTCRSRWSPSPSKKTENKQPP